jgi:hypothetical protein
LTHAALEQQPRKRWFPGVGAAFRGWRLTTSVYGGIRAVPSTPPSQRVTIKAPLEASPGHSSVLSTPTSEYLSWNFAAIEAMDQDHADTPLSPLLDLSDLRPSQLLGEGYSSQLSFDVETTSRHTHWKHLTTQHWRNLVPNLVMPFL